jgi:hypothetical protein
VAVGANDPAGRHQLSAARVSNNLRCRAFDTRRSLCSKQEAEGDARAAASTAVGALGRTPG